MATVKIGIPRALHYHKYHVLWESFFKELGCSVIVSPPTNRAIMATGVNLAIDESCLSVKLYLGHVNDLQNKVDYVFIPRIVSLKKDEFLCVKFMALGDIVRNTLPKIKILEYTVDANTLWQREDLGLMRIGWQLTHNPLKTIRAYQQAKHDEQVWQHERIAGQQASVTKRNRSQPAILFVSHPYTTYDTFLGKPIRDFLESQGVDLLYADIMDHELACKLSTNISSDLYWTYHKELLGGVEYYKDMVDGIIFVMTFPCGPDTLVTALCQNKITGLPIITITLDELQSETGLKTRLESFVDILKMRLSPTAIPA